MTSASVCMLSIPHYREATSEAAIGKNLRPGMRLGLSQRIPGFGRATDKKKGRAAELCPRDDKDCPGAGRIWMRISCCSTLAAFPPIAMHMRPQGKRRGQPRQFPGWPLWSWLFPVASGPNRGASARLKPLTLSMAISPLPSTTRMRLPARLLHGLDSAGTCDICRIDRRGSGHGLLSQNKLRTPRFRYQSLTRRGPASA